MRTPERYIERVAAGASPEAGCETLDPAARREEAFALALRTRGGRPAAAAAPRPAAADLVAAGLLDQRGRRVSC